MECGDSGKCKGEGWKIEVKAHYHGPQMPGVTTVSVGFTALVPLKCIQNLRKKYSFLYYVLFTFAMET
jgi:hypothetical protein